MKAGRIAPRTVAGELGTVGPHVSIDRADAGVASEELRLRAAAPAFALDESRLALVGAPPVTPAAIAQLAASVARIGPVLTSPNALAGLEPAALQALAPRVEAVRRMTAVLAELLVLDQAVTAARRATRHA